MRLGARDGHDVRRLWLIARPFERVRRQQRQHRRWASTWAFQKEEPRWIARMATAQQEAADVDARVSMRPKYYVLPMFPYPSGQLHMGHVRVYTISDVIARYKRARGYAVLHPIGWDAFGLPAENAAIERQIDPQTWTLQNIQEMQQQLKRLAISFDWSREIKTCDPAYYKHTQSIFLKLYKAGLAYQKEAPVNWDPIDQTVLANEQVDEAGRSWRSGALVEKRTMKQWFFKITAHADHLLAGLDGLHWPESVKTMQRHWIGRRVDAEDKKKVTYRLNDWLLSRQRYWGTPIPIIHCQDCGVQPVPETDLPVTLPVTDIDLTTKGEGGKVLASIDHFVNTTCPSCQKPAKRETDTMDTFVDSSWYYLRYLDPHNADVFCDPAQRDALYPVNAYIGGMEHAILHLLYARFFGRFLAGGKEPFPSLIAQGMVHSLTYKTPDGAFVPSSEVAAWQAAHPGSTLTKRFEKMSKSKYNGVSPLSMLEKYGSDVTRLYTLFKAPIEQVLEWDEEGIVGFVRWTNRLCVLFSSLPAPSSINWNNASRDIKKKEEEAMREYAAVVQAVEKALDERVPAINVAIAQLMKWTTSLTASDDALKGQPFFREMLQGFSNMLRPMAPSLAAHLSSLLLLVVPNSSSAADDIRCLQPAWPVVDPRYTVHEEAEFVVQLNGKKMLTLPVSIPLLEKGDHATIREVLSKEAKMQQLLAQHTVQRWIIVPQRRLMNLVTR